MRCAQNSSQQRRTSAWADWKKSAVPKTDLCLWQISKTTMDLFTFRPSFTLDFCCSHVAFFRTSRLQSAKSTCTRLDESPGDEEGRTNQETKKVAPTSGESQRLQWPAISNRKHPKNSSSKHLRTFSIPTQPQFVHSKTTIPWINSIPWSVSCCSSYNFISSCLCALLATTHHVERGTLGGQGNSKKSRSATFHTSKTHQNTNHLYNSHDIPPEQTRGMFSTKSSYQSQNLNPPEPSFHTKQSTFGCQELCDFFANAGVGTGPKCPRSGTSSLSNRKASGNTLYWCLKCFPVGCLKWVSIILQWI